MNLRELINNNKFKLKKLEKVVQQIDSKADAYAAMSDSELKNQTNIFKERYANGESLDSMLPDAFAAIKEADRRVLGLYPYDVQLMGGLVLHQGNLAEMRTGEGKTLTETMPVYLNAITGKGVHVITVNEYLSQRDASEMGQVFKWMGLTVGVNGEDLSTYDKKQAYACDITYSTNSELAFDYLRDNQVIYKRDQVQRGLNYAIIDEVDSILIDEARTPLIISDTADSYKELYIDTDRLVKTLKKDDYRVDDETKTVSLTASGIKKANEYLSIRNLYDSNHFTLAHYVDEALKANYTMELDKDYVIQDDQIMIVDTFTGRVMEGRRFSDGLHQALEAKEADKGVKIRDANRTESSITYQNFFRMYNKLAGMSGTAATEAKEFYETYHMDVITIPTNKPIQRVDLPDVLYVTKEAKFEASAELIEEVHKTGQPILVGTGSVEDSEYLSQLLNKKGISHTVLNAKNNAKEAQIVMQAGQMGAVTIATNMAGRGTDIKLGPNVENLGGLYVLGTEKFESRRIDNQLRGRAGRQGEKGTTVFFVSLQDDLIQRFGTESIKKGRDKLIANGEVWEPIQSKILNKAISAAQKCVEGNNFDERKNTFRYDDILRHEREKIYSERQKVLNFTDKDSFKPYLLAMFKRTINRYVDLYINDKEKNMDGLYQFMSSILRISDYDQRLQVKDMSRLEIKKYLYQVCVNDLHRREIELRHPEQIKTYEKYLILRAVDVNWKNNIDRMEQLRQSITLRGYGQYNPLVEYQNSSSVIYKEMLANIDTDVTKSFMHTQVQEAGREKSSDDE